MIGFAARTRKLVTDYNGFRANSPYDCIGQTIFTIGGSTTEDVFQDNNTTWSANLQNVLNLSGDSVYNVINTGMSGLRAEHHYHNALYLQRYCPNYFIFLVGWNDWNQAIKVSYKDQSLDPIDYSYSIFAAIVSRYFYIYDHSFYKSIASRKVVKQERAPDDGEYYRKQNNSLSRREIYWVDANLMVSDKYKADIDAIVELCLTLPVRCMFVEQAVAYQEKATEDIKKRFWATPPNEKYTLTLENLSEVSSKYNAYLRVRLEDTNIPLCMTHVVMSPDTTHFYDDGHYNDNGSEVLAERISQCFKDAFE